jgi:hypothetical protein
MGYPNSAKPTLGVWGHAPSKTLRQAVFFFSRKEAKAVVLLRRRLWATQPSAKPTLGVWGRAPSKTLRQAVFFFSSKEAKAVVRFAKEQ